MKKLGRQLMVECVGTAWLVFVGCGSAVLNGAMQPAWNALVTPLAFGAALTLACYAFGRVYPAHFNPAVTVGSAVAQRFPMRDVLPYVAAQIVGACCGALLLACVANGRPGFDLDTSEFSANGFGEHSPADYQLHSALIMEALGTFVLVSTYLVVARRRRAWRYAPLALGACMTLLYMLALPVTNASLNPARSTGTALLVGDWALDQLWLFWAAPLAGALLAGLIGPRLCARPRLSGEDRPVAGVGTE